MCVCVVVVVVVSLFVFVSLLFVCLFDGSGRECSN